MIASVTVSLQVERCHRCGKYHAHELGNDGGTAECRRCLLDALRVGSGEVCQRDLTISALRGALTKARKAARRG